MNHADARAEMEQGEKTVDETDRSLDPRQRADLDAIAAFERDPDLTRLEAYLARFNIFEVVGFVRAETRHSDFLAFLCDPGQTHGLGDAFARRYLRGVLATAGPGISGLAPTDLDGWDLSGLTARREWRYVDVLLVVAAHRLAVVIENKIDADEGRGQLATYLVALREGYPVAHGWRHLAIYLTPRGQAPSLSEYLAVDYGVVAEAVTAAAADRPALDPAVGVLMTHYVEMLRRHIVPDHAFEAEIERLVACHPRVVERIVAHERERGAWIKATLAGLVRDRAADGLFLDEETAKGNQVLRWGHADWAWLPPSDTSWTPSRRMLLFSFWVLRDRLQLVLWVAPGPEEARQRVIEIAKAHPDLYRVPALPRDDPGFTSVFTDYLVRPEEYAGATVGEITALLGERFAAFADDLLPKLVAPFREVSSSIGIPLAGGEDAGVATSEFATESGDDR